MPSKPISLDKKPWVFSIYKKFRKKFGNYRLGRARSICHKSHLFTGPSLSPRQFVWGAESRLLTRDALERSGEIASRDRNGDES